jgi:TonB family protein
MTLLVEYTIKVSLIVLTGLVVTALLRKRSASARHWVLSMAMLAALALPLMQRALPAWSGPRAIQSRFTANTNTARDARPFDVLENAHVDVRVATAPVSTPFSGLTLMSALTTAWAAGTALSVVMLAVGLARLTWLSSRARLVTNAVWIRVFDEIVQRDGLRRSVRVLQSDHPSLLVTWGVLRPSVIVPRVALDWPEGRVRVVLCHELAHIRRGDWAIQIAGEVVRSIYWFNPLVWIACRWLRQESEEACDDAVLAGGVEGSDYAAHLVDAARALKHDAAKWVPAAAMGRSSSLERRVRAMLNVSLVRKPATRRFQFAAAATLLAATSFVAAIQLASATLSGSVVDSTGAPIPNAPVLLTNKTTGAKFEVVTDASGQFAFVPLPAGEYVLTSSRPGFKQAEAMVSLTGKPVRRDLTLALGTLTERISIVGPPREGVSGGVAGGVPGGVRGGVAGGVAGSVAGEVERRAYDRDLAACTSLPTGGRVRAPYKLRDVRPVYPENLQSAGIGGTVILTATIGTDGTVTNIDVVKSVHPDLDAAAIEAVRQWRFDGTLLNCTPTEAAMTVSLDFSPK